MARAVAEVDLQDFEESINMMVHAWPGQGKTVWSTGAPNCQLVSSEPGAIAAKRQGRRGVGLVRIKSWTDAKDWLTALEAGKFDHRKWAIIDTISTIQQKNQNEVLDLAVADNPRRDPDIPAIQDYQKQQNSLKRWVERVVDYPINTIFLAHTMRTEDQDGGTMFIPTILGGADKGFPIANYVMGLMNAVGYMEMRSVKTDDGQTMARRILWQPYHDSKRDIRYTAKDQFDCFGRFTDDLDFPGHLALIEGSGSGEETPKPARRRRAA
jgi:AAA domain